MNEACEQILTDWRHGGLARCLAGEDAPAFPSHTPARIVTWDQPREIRRPWASCEDAVMRERYFTEGCVALLRALPLRSKDAIRSRARKLGVQSTKCGMRT